jgi:hypothetical protein
MIQINSYAFIVFVPERRVGPPNLWRPRNSRQISALHHLVPIVGATVNNTKNNTNLQEKKLIS